MKYVAILIIFIAVVFTIFAVNQTENRSTKCKSKGGVLVKTIEGYKCMSMNSGVIL